MDEAAKRERLAELQAAMDQKHRCDAPADHEADAWVISYRDMDDETGRTVRWGVPVWLPKAEYDEWQRLRFPVGD